MTPSTPTKQRLSRIPVRTKMPTTNKSPSDVALSTKQRPSRIPVTVNIKKPTTYESSSDVVLTEFTIFPKLPRELRDKIWELATSSTPSRALVVHSADWTVPQYVPCSSILHSSSISRAETLGLYLKNE